jgi:sugar-specific transcriptional regulator TrmB
MTTKKMKVEKPPLSVKGLSDFGLTENDSNVYLYLLQKGTEVAGSKIANVLGLHRQYVYNSLEKLLGLHLIENITVGKRNVYKALPPYQLTKIAKQKLENAADLEKELNLLSTVGHEQDFEVYVGERQVDDFEINVLHNLKENDVQYIIGGSTQAFMEFFDNRYEEYADFARKKKLVSYYVGCPNDEPYVKRVKKAQYQFHAKILTDLPKTLISTVVRFDTVTIYSFAQPHIVYVLKSKIVADDYKKFFDMLWNLPGKML